MNKRNRHIPIPVAFFNLKDKPSSYLSSLENSNYLVKEVFSIGEALEFVRAKIPYYLIVDSIEGLNIDINFARFLSEISKEVLDFTQVILLTQAELKDPKLIKVKNIEIMIVSKRMGVSHFLQELQVMTHKRKVKNKVLESDWRQRIQMQFEGTIESSTSDGLYIEAPVKLASNTNVKISSRYLEKLGVSECIFRRTQEPSVLELNQLFLNEFMMVGLDPTVTNRLSRLKMR